MSIPYAQLLAEAKSELAALTWLAEQPAVAAALELAMSDETAKETAALQIVEAVREMGFAGEEPEPPTKRARTESNSTLVPPPAVQPQAVGHARCVCVVLSGMRGAGKTALCNILTQVLGGEHVHYDEITRGQKRSFPGSLKEIFKRSLQETRGWHAEAEGGSDEAKPDPLLLFIDRTHILKSQREETINTLVHFRWRQRHCRTLLVEFSHSEDVFGYDTGGQLSKRFGERHIALCEERIRNRGVAHHALRPSEKLRSVLQKEAKLAQPPSPDELRNFDGCVSLQLADSPPQQALAVIKELQDRWLNTSEDLALKVELAWQVFQRAEDQWRQTATPREQSQWRAQCRQATEKADKAAEEAAAAKRKTKLKCWKLDLPEVGSKLREKGVNMETLERFQVELLTVPEGNLEEAAQEHGLSKEALEVMTDALESLEGDDTLEVTVTKIVYASSVVYCVVELPPVPHVGKVPHFMLCRDPKVEPLPLVEDLLQHPEDAVVIKETAVPVPVKGHLIMETREQIEKL
ncbi:unnamed protein product [Effrenium voratum]|nr:unnamed protein product [Effrenium voratum]